MIGTKKIVGTVLALSMLAGTFTGCSGGGKNSEGAPGTTGGTKAESSAVAPSGQLPVMKEKTTFKVMASAATYVKDLPTNEFTKYYEDLTNIKLDFQIVPTANKSDKVNVALAGGDYPDFFLNMSIPQSSILSYAKQGIILPLTPYMDKYCTNLAGIFRKYPGIKSVSTYPDGNVYTVSQFQETYNVMYPAKMWVYRPWMEKLGLKEPETTEDFYRMLKAFKERDPNGNGKADEIPLMGCVGSVGSQFDMFLMTPFINNDGNKRFIVKNGKLDAAYVQLEWKEGLKYMNKLYKDGLFTSESFTQRSDQRKQTVASPDVTVGAIPSNAVNGFVDSGQKDKRDLNYFTIKPLMGPSGNAYCVYNPDSVVTTSGQVVITNKCKYPEAIARWADGFLTEEMTMRSIWGVEGSNWRKAKADEKGRLGGPGKFVLINAWTDIQNASWKRNGPAIQPLELTHGEVDIPFMDNNPFLEAKRNYIGHEMPKDMIVGQLILDSDSMAKIADIDKSINNYVSEQLASFVLGEKNVDAEWDSYVNELKKMGLDKYLEVYGECYKNKK